MTTPIPRTDLARAYAGKRVLVTGHTGFKGAWLTTWLDLLGAEVSGLALAPATKPSLFDVLDVGARCARHEVGDVRDLDAVRAMVRATRPDFVFHLAAQALVRTSYAQPVDTFGVNVMGTAHLLEALRLERSPCAVVVVTSDKCYENREWPYGYRENDALGGHDPYSASKGAAELVTASFRASFFPPSRLSEHGIAVATARAGNVIGGGDWAENRIVPDAIRALSGGRPIDVRNPGSVRPWQHVLEPLGGYLLLGDRLANGTIEARASHCEGWNFGPRVDAAVPVRALVEALISAWGSGAWNDGSIADAPHEAGQLRLSIEKAASKLGWSPRWTFDETLARTAAWYRVHAEGRSREELEELTRGQIREYMSGAKDGERTS